MSCSIPFLFYSCASPPFRISVSRTLCILCLLVIEFFSEGLILGAMVPHAFLPSGSSHHRGQVAVVASAVVRFLTRFIPGFLSRHGSVPSNGTTDNQYSLPGLHVRTCTSGNDWVGRSPAGSDPKTIVSFLILSAQAIKAHGGRPSHPRTIFNFHDIGRPTSGTSLMRRARSDSSVCSVCSVYPEITRLTVPRLHPSLLPRIGAVN